MLQRLNNHIEPIVTRDRHDGVSWLIVLGLFLHGPVDIALTYSYWHLESNPVVMMLGLPAWIGVKTITVVTLAVVWYDLYRRDSTRLVEWALIVAVVALGIVFVAPNIAIVIGYR